MARMHSPSPIEAHTVDSGSPPPQSLSKRDKKRAMLSDRLTDMIASFSDNRDHHFSAQIRAVQQDMRMIVNADLYTNRPLEDPKPEIDHLLSSAPETMALHPNAQQDYAAGLGNTYRKFVEEVNDALEERDAGLTQLWNKYQNQLSELTQTHNFKVQIALEEHARLSNTLRERLVQQVSNRRAKLMREKEQLDLTDSNALLLNPNQFSIANPTSPGGPSNPRKTRHTRHRAGDPDDLVSAAATQESKRKRKAYEDADESPGPIGRNIDIGVGSPFREAKSKTQQSQQESPLMSIDKLFTEKELSMNMNQAAIAAAHFFHRMRNQGIQSTRGPDESFNPDNDLGTALNNDVEMEDDLPATPGAAEMDRTASTSHHATRGATRNALGDLALAAERSLPYPMPMPMPVVLPANISGKPNQAAPPPPPVNTTDADSDFALMSRNADPTDPLNERLLETACQPLQTRQFEFQAPSSVTLSSDINAIPGIPPHMEVGGVAMSAQSSMGGMSDAGPGLGFGVVPMVRSESLGMRRTVSQTGGFLGVSEGRKGRGRGV